MDVINYAFFSDAVKFKLMIDCFGAAKKWPWNEKKSIADLLFELSANNGIFCLKNIDLW